MTDNGYSTSVHAHCHRRDISGQGDNAVGDDDSVVVAPVPVVRPVVPIAIAISWMMVTPATSVSTIVVILNIFDRCLCTMADGGAISAVGCAALALAVMAGTPMPSDRHAAKKEDANLFIGFSLIKWLCYQRP